MLTEWEHTAGRSHGVEITAAAGKEEQGEEQEKAEKYSPGLAATVPVLEGGRRGAERVVSTAGTPPAQSPASPRV